ncbi:MAG: ATPase domain-containing protein [Candidatus Bathyarchaeia archaeon]
MRAGQERIPTGCSGLDKLLNGGLARGEVALVYGEAATGKTTTVIQTAIAAAKLGLKILYLDSDHSFTQQRFHQIAGVKSDEISQLILLFLPETFSEQRSIVESLENYVTPALGLVIIDSMSSLYRAAFSGSESIFSLNRDLSRQVAYLGDLSASRRIACILTSQVHARLTKTSGEIEPVARRALFHFPQTILRIRNTPRTNVKEFVLERRGGSDVARTSCLIALGETGLSDVST